MIRAIYKPDIIVSRLILKSKLFCGAVLLNAKELNDLVGLLLETTFQNKLA